GEEVEVVGEYREFNGLSEVVGAATVTGTAAVPAPAVVGVPDLGEPWEGVLVEIADVVVVTPDNAFGDFEVAGGDATTWVIDDIHRWEVFPPVVGQTFTRVTGPLVEEFGHYGLLPRDA